MILFFLNLFLFLNENNEWKFVTGTMKSGMLDLKNALEDWLIEDYIFGWLDDVNKMIGVKILGELINECLV